MLRNVWMICPVKATPIWTLSAWKSVRKKANISSVTSGKKKRDISQPKVKAGFKNYEFDVAAAE